MIQIIIVNKHEAERNQIQAALDAHSDFEVIGHGKDSYDALRLVEELKPQIAILDICLDIIDGLTIAPMLKQKSPSTAILFHTALAEDEHIYKALFHEVHGYILKEDANHLAYAIRLIIQGRRFISNTVNEKIYRFFLDKKKALSCPDKKPVLKELSCAEIGILTFICLGYSTKEIAERCFLSPGTVRNYISSTLQKLGLQKRAQIPPFVIKHGLIHI